MPGLRILLVEDELLIRLILAESLMEAGLQVVEADSGEQAADYIEGIDGIDVLLTDMQMPGRLDGAAVAQRARMRHPGIPVIYMTGRPEVLRGIGALGARDAVLRKPFAPSEVLATIHRLTGEPATQGLPERQAKPGE